MQEIIGLAVTIVFAAWIIDTWTRGALVRGVRSWWSDLSAEPARASTPSAEAVIAEAIRITREAADRRRGEVQ